QLEKPLAERPFGYLWFQVLDATGAALEPPAYAGERLPPLALVQARARERWARLRALTEGAVEVPTAPRTVQVQLLAEGDHPFAGGGARAGRGGVPPVPSAPGNRRRLPCEALCRAGGRRAMNKRKQRISWSVWDHLRYWPRQVLKNPLWTLQLVLRLTTVAVFG